MQITHQSSQYCEFAMFALFDQWESDKSIIEEQIAEDNGIPIEILWDFWGDYMAMKGKD